MTKINKSKGNIVNWHCLFKLRNSLKLTSEIRLALEPIGDDARIYNLGNRKDMRSLGMSRQQIKDFRHFVESKIFQPYEQVVALVRFNVNFAAFPGWAQVSQVQCEHFYHSAPGETIGTYVGTLWGIVSMNSDKKKLNNITPTFVGGGTYLAQSVGGRDYDARSLSDFMDYTIKYKEFFDCIKSLYAVQR